MLNIFFENANAANIISDETRTAHIQVLMLSPTSPRPLTWAEASQYCRTLSSSCEVLSNGQGCDKLIHKESWRLPSFEELRSFAGATQDLYLWTQSIPNALYGFNKNENYIDSYIIYNLKDGKWSANTVYANRNLAKCVR